MSNAVNGLTSMVGLKLFKGGPYPDAGMGDMQAQQAQQYMAQIAPLIAQIASNAGVVNPLNPQATAQVTNPGAFGQTAPNPYDLSPMQQAQVNQQAGIDRKAYDRILSSVKADLSARGLSDSSSMTAAEAYLGQQLQTQLGSEQLQAGENAYQNREQALQQIAGLLGQGYGAQSAATASQKQSALQNTQMGQSNFASFFGPLLGRVLGNAFPQKSSMQPYLGGTFGQNMAPGSGQPTMADTPQGAFNQLANVNWGSIYQPY